MSLRRVPVLVGVCGSLGILLLAGCAKSDSATADRAQRAAFSPPIVVPAEFTSGRIVASDGSGRSLNFYNRRSAAQASVSAQD